MLNLLILLATASLADPVLTIYDARYAGRLVPLLVEVVRFPTFAGNAEAHAAQKTWLARTARELGFEVRDRGKVTEIELPAAPGSPVLGLVIHGDVQPVEATGWTFPPFEGRVENGHILGRGAADDKGPLIQALLAMKALSDSGVKRTHTIRLLVGSEEESSATEMGEYLKDHRPPDYSLVLDSEFPVVVGEKAWDGLAVATSLAERGDPSKPYTVLAIDAGLSPSIVPDRAELTLRWRSGTPQWQQLRGELGAANLPPGTRLEIHEEGGTLRVVAHGRAAHSGVNLTGGRNALVALARAVEGKLARGGADDLLAFARTAGIDLHGSGLGIEAEDPVWGRYGVNVATVKPNPGDRSQAMLTINLRRIPPHSGRQAKEHLRRVVHAFNCRNDSWLEIVDSQSYFEDEPLAFPLDAPLVRRLMDVYARATGERAKPAISGGGTYAKRLPNAIAFGMWFPGKPYPGHDRDEKIAVADLQRGARVLVHALADIASGPRIEKALESPSVAPEK